MSTEAYYPAKPGDPILAETWNRVQTTVRDAIDDLNTKLVGKLSVTGLDTSGPIKLSGPAVIQRGATALPETRPNELGLYATDPGAPIRLTTHNADIKFFGDGGVGSIANLTITALGDATLRGRLTTNNGLTVTGGVQLSDSGVVQRGGAAITATKDLGLYSRVDGNWIRVVTNGGSVRFFSDGDQSPAGTTPNLAIEPSGDANLRGRFTANNGLTVTTGATAINSGLTVAGGLTVTTGATAINSGLTVAGGLTVNTGATAITRGLTVANGLTVTTGATAINGGLTVAGATAIHGGLTVAGATAIDGRLFVANTASINGGLTVNTGHTVVQSVTVTDQLNVIGGGLNVNNGATAINAGLTVNTGATAINGGLTVNTGVQLGDSGVVQRGGAAITATKDLGLYSTLEGHWIRMVTNRAAVVFFGDGDKGPAGTTRNLTIEPNGDVSVRGNLTVGGKLLGGEATIPDGIVMLWSGNTTNIPSGWLHCNGQNSTPDLRNERFIYIVRRAK